MIGQFRLNKSAAALHDGLCHAKCTVARRRGRVGGGVPCPRLCCVCRKLLAHACGKACAPEFVVKRFFTVKHFFAVLIKPIIKKQKRIDDAGGNFP